MNIAIAATLALFLGYVLLRHHARENRRLSIEVCRALLQMICDLQRHRGLSIAVIGGDTRFDDERFHSEKALHHAIQGLTDKYAGIHPVLRTGQWEGVVTHWRSLCNNWRFLDFVTNLYAHNDVIMGCIGVLHAVVKKQSRLLGEKRVDILLEWPTLIEHLGMLRALGMHMLSRDADGDKQATLAMTDHRQHVVQSLKLLNGQLPDPTIQSATENLLRRVAVLCDGNLDNYSAQNYYTDITSVIDRWYQMMNSQIMISDIRRHPVHDLLKLRKPV